MPSKQPEPDRRRSSSRWFGSQGSKEPQPPSRRRYSADWDLGSANSAGLEPGLEHREVYRTRSGSTSASRPSPARRTYSRDSATRTVSDSSSSRRRRRKVYNVVDMSMDRRSSTSMLPGSRTSSTPYPSFSKAHSREAVVPRNDDTYPRRSQYPLDVTEPPYRSTRTSSGKPSSSSPIGNTRPIWNGPSAPPSPPLTADGSPMRRVHSGSSIRREAAEAAAIQSEAKRSNLSNFDEPVSSDPPLRFSASRTSLRDAEEGRSSLNPPRQTSYSQSPLRQDASSANRNRDVSPVKSSTPPNRRSPTRKGPISQPSVVSHPATDSDATPMVPVNRQSARPPTLLSNRGVSPSSESESFPKTPNGPNSQIFASDVGDRKETPAIEVITVNPGEQELTRDFDGVSPNTGLGAVPPPPPPPPPLEVGPSGVPKVDYLLPNGGLSKQITKKFVAAASGQAPLETYQQYMSPPQQVSRASDAYTPFAPFKSLLDDIENVITRNGSVAVATGYKSVARKLLDRLETVFARNVSSQLCDCVMCKTDRMEARSPTVDTGVSWGEVLELVSGRKGLPPWPPFSLPSGGAGLGVTTVERKAPMQKLDIDVPEEYRDHYIRQSRKTKMAVDKWLASQPEDHSSPPTEVDDETMTFAMLTYLEPHQRRLFTALVRGLVTVPDSRSPTPAPTGPKSDVLLKAGAALERLYRLPRPPRDPETSMYLLKNPSLHSSLATLAAISQQEWEILVSGRFDGFLVSGAEHQFPSMGPVGSRGVTPFSRKGISSRGGAPTSYFPPSTATPPRSASTASAGGSNLPTGSNTGTITPAANSNGLNAGPVQMDEETEIAVLAEVEREIFQGMEALEDAFEALHVKAESVRRALRERGAGLSLNAQAMGRRGSERELDARLGTPFDGGLVGTPGSTWGATPSQSYGQGVIDVGGRFGGDSDDGLDDAASLAPDDSASNVGWKDRKHRHHRRRRPRRTPAPVDEVSE